MELAFKVFLSMSVSGALLILILFLGKLLLKDKVSRQWQYYIWLIVVLRLLIPFGPEINLMGKVYQTIGNMITPASPVLQQKQSVSDIQGGAPPDERELGFEKADHSKEELSSAFPPRNRTALLISHIWLVTAFGMLIRKVTIYQSFIRYVNAGSIPVSDIEILDRFSVIAEHSGVKKPIELCVNNLISSPMLTGFFHPCIILPNIDISENDFLYIIMHELTHYKRRDMLYKWLVQITVCLHWYNPLIHLMCREITKECEFSCDEAVLKKIGYDHAGEYGKILLDAMAAVGKYKENLGSVTLSENKRLLKERLGAIMNFKKKSKRIQILTGILTVGVIFGAFFVGIYSVTSASDVNRMISGKGSDSGKGLDSGEGYDSDDGLDSGKGLDLVHQTEHDSKVTDHSSEDELRPETPPSDAENQITVNDDEPIAEEPQPGIDASYNADADTEIYDNEPIAEEPQSGIVTPYQNVDAGTRNYDNDPIAEEPYPGMDAQNADAGTENYDNDPMTEEHPSGIAVSHQSTGGNSAMYATDPIARELQFNPDDLNELPDDTNSGQSYPFPSAEPYYGNVELH